MSGPLRIDVHMHLYETTQSGEWWKAGYEIWEYGPKDGVEFSHFSGTVDDAMTAMREAGYAHGVAVNLFGMELFRLEAIDALPEDLSGADRDAAVADIEASLPDRMRDYNRWLVGALSDVPEITAFVAVDPWALSPEENVTHLREMAEKGARGIKLHPVVQRFEPADPRMRPVFEACREMGLTVLSHTGSAKGGERFAKPEAFVDVLRDLPELRVVLAHVGGGAWRQTVDVARAFPQVTFDICEIIEWTGAPNAPTAEQLAAMVTEVGPDRVMLGTDFPWYDLERTADLVMDLPDLPASQKEAILGENAARILDLPV